MLASPSLRVYFSVRGRSKTIAQKLFHKVEPLHSNGGLRVAMIASLAALPMRRKIWARKRTARRMAHVWRRATSGTRATLRSKQIDG